MMVIGEAEATILPWAKKRMEPFRINGINKAAEDAIKALSAAFPHCDYELKSRIECYRQELSSLIYECHHQADKHQGTIT